MVNTSQRIRPAGEREDPSCLRVHRTSYMAPEKLQVSYRDDARTSGTRCEANGLTAVYLLQGTAHSADKRHRYDPYAERSPRLQSSTPT